MATVEKPIINNVRRKVYLRPIKSPNLPKNATPNGLTTKPTAQPATASYTLASGSPVGKNSLFNTVVASMP